MDVWNVFFVRCFWGSSLRLVGALAFRMLAGPSRQRRHRFMVHDPRQQT